MFSANGAIGFRTTDGHATRIFLCLPHILRIDADGPVAAYGTEGRQPFHFFGMRKEAEHVAKGGSLAGSIQTGYDNMYRQFIRPRGHVVK